MNPKSGNLPKNSGLNTRLLTKEGYTLTALTALLITQKALAGNAPAGFQTPAMAYGKNLIMEVDGVIWEEVT